MSRIRWIYRCRGLFIGITYLKTHQEKILLPKDSDLTTNFRFQRRGFMDNRIKISVCGDEDVIGVIRDSLNTLPDFEVINSSEIAQSDIIYWVYGKGPSMKKYFLFWIKKDPIIINHWIGSDVLEEMERAKKPGIARIKKFIEDCIFRWKMNTGGLITFAGAPWLVDELAKTNLPAAYLPITTIDEKKLGTVENQHVKDIDFLSYIPFNRFNFYGGDKIVKLAARWPDYNFLIICADIHEISQDFMEKLPGNMSISPRVEWGKMPELYQRSKYFIRYTQHDSESLSVFEALYYNLQVLWTYDFPHTIKIESQEKLSDSIPSLVKNWESNYPGHDYIIKNFSIEKWRADFLKVIHSKL